VEAQWIQLGARFIELSEGLGAGFRKRYLSFTGHGVRADVERSKAQGANNSVPKVFLLSFHIGRSHVSDKLAGIAVEGDFQVGDVEVQLAVVPGELHAPAILHGARAIFYGTRVTSELETAIVIANTREIPPALGNGSGDIGLEGFL